MTAVPDGPDRSADPDRSAGSDRSAGRRVAAGAALAALAALAVGLVGFVFYSRGAVLVAGLAAGAGVALATALGWWAFTTSRAWKRRLNVAGAACVALAIVIGVAAFSTVYGVAVLAVAVLAVAYVATVRLAFASTPVGSAESAAGAPPPARPWLLVNPRSGNGAAARLGLVDAASARGIAVRLLEPGDDPVELARAAVAAGADAVGVSGGDGSLGAVASAAMALRVPFFCVPTGTRDHFARDVGLDREAPLTALDALAGRERRIDVGLVGGRVFLNNVSLGVYANMVHESDYRADKLGAAHAVLPPTFRGEADEIEMSFRDGSGELHTGAVVLLVANNEYNLSSLSHFGARPTLDASILQVSALRATTGARLAEALLRTQTRQPAVARPGGREAGAGWTQWTSEMFVVDSAAPHLPAAIDGEAVVLDAPVEFRILPRALRVLVPATTRPGRVGTAGAFRPGIVRRLWTVARGGDGG